MSPLVKQTNTKPRPLGEVAANAAGEGKVCLKLITSQASTRHKFACKLSVERSETCSPKRRASGFVLTLTKSVLQKLFRQTKPHLSGLKCGKIFLLFDLLPDLVGICYAYF